MFGKHCKRGEDKECFFKALKSKKQIAIADREHELVRLAVNLVAEGGYANLTMDKLAAASPYSKGTVYNHFCSKEDVIAAFAILALKKNINLFQKALSFEGNSREKLVAFHVAYNTFFSLEPVLSNCVLVCKSPWVKEKASSERMAQMNELDDTLVASADSLVTQAVQQGALSLSQAASTDTIVFGNWALAFGANSLINSARNATCIERVQDPYTVLNVVNMLLDGMGWKPLSSEHDYRKPGVGLSRNSFQKN